MPRWVLTLPEGLSCSEPCVCRGYAFFGGLEARRVKFGVRSRGIGEGQSLVVQTDLSRAAVAHSREQGQDPWHEGHHLGVFLLRFTPKICHKAPKWPQPGEKSGREGQSSSHFPPKPQPGSFSSSSHAAKSPKLLRRGRGSLT